MIESLKKYIGHLQNNFYCLRIEWIWVWVDEFISLDLQYMLEYNVWINWIGLNNITVQIIYIR